MQSKHIIKPILFFSGLFILLYGLSYLFLPYNSTGEGPYKKLNGILSAPKDTIDYITLGDSECSTSISPMELWNKHGYAGYNCGVPGQRLQDTYYLLQQILNNQSPKVVLLETNAFYRSFDYSNALQDAVDKAAQNIFPVYKYHNSWKYFNLGTLENIPKKPGHKIPRAYKGYQYNSVTKPYLDGPYVHKTDKIEPIDAQPLFYLNKIVDLCKERNIQLILYSAPTPLCWTYEKHNAADSFASKNNLTYIDLNLHAEKLKIDWARDTRDKGNHMNYYGAKKVTDYIGDYLSEHTDLTDRRGQKQYASWNTALKKYLKLTQVS
ncbi:hypothetical protein [Anaerocolumna xylanovorans]|uniref:SGNH/GDSL hydrolase family protein n=1 Tax=Anaerocolumna xylanovorans DSM 12503 TaxID=1121345 RepID=A0A1M7Y774_9FIRM|nr:hypothetical protein [Anaerocolumna xylanovorans]SHO48376.1 hypothetical protein SAMN02745217_01804 [Anaerocolumna xylanovorans DSM 12503]